MRGKNGVTRVHSNDGCHRHCECAKQLRVGGRPSGFHGAYRTWQVDLLVKIWFGERLSGEAGCHRSHWSRGINVFLQSE